ncbi:hypothetical protein ACFQJC_06800 [Haloferax namakaokahaiae]|uniref:Uncharacterized protein n=1 Tax=Haloferax namakaokahaiae TaxID=1748331 RepID=A0ABD5ZE05_9EURY
MLTTTSIVKKLVRDQISNGMRESSTGQNRASSMRVPREDIKTAAKEGAREALAEERSDRHSIQGGDSQKSNRSSGWMSPMRLLFVGAVLVFLIRRRSKTNQSKAEEQTETMSETGGMDTTSGL